jgi:aldose 1-epimerase
VELLNVIRSIQSRVYGTLPSGGTVEQWTLTGRGGLTVEIITYGGIVTRMLAPDRNAHLDDVVLGFDNLDSYLAGRFYFGAITGRVAGRIPNAAFTIEGKRCDLVRNDPPHHLHGGVQGFDKRLWTATTNNRADGAPSLRLSYLSPDGEEGYPGNVQVAVTYTVTDDNLFLIESEATADRATPFSLTHHSYFNLAGHSAGSIADHSIEIFADEFVPLGEDLILLGRLEPVEGSSSDLRLPRRLGDVIPSLVQHHGDMYAARAGSADERVPVARVMHEQSGRVLTVSTTDPFLQIYTGSHLEGPVAGKSGAIYSRHAGLCLECEGYPNPSNAALGAGTRLDPGRSQSRSTAYAFSIAGQSAPALPADRGTSRNRQNRASLS